MINKDPFSRHSLQPVSKSNKPNLIQKINKRDPPVENAKQSLAELLAKGTTITLPAYTSKVKANHMLVFNPSVPIKGASKGHLGNNQSNPVIVRQDDSN